MNQPVNKGLRVIRNLTEEEYQLGELDRKMREEFLRRVALTKRGHIEDIVRGK